MRDGGTRRTGTEIRQKYEALVGAGVRAAEALASLAEEFAGSAYGDALEALCGDLAAPAEWARRYPGLFGAGDGEGEGDGRGGDPAAGGPAGGSAPASDEVGAARDRGPFEGLVRAAVSAGATDVHVEQASPVAPARVRFRVDGELRDEDPVAAGDAPALFAAIKGAAAMDVATADLPQSGRVIVRVEDGDGSRDLELSAEVGPNGTGEAACLRFVPRFTRESLEARAGRILTPPVRDRVSAALARPHGLFLCTGPTGSGKTTTSQLALCRKLRPERKVVAVVDGFELELEGLHTIQVRPAAGLSFESALRHVLRMDADVIYCNEVRDFETAQLLVSAALTGRFVLVEMHAPSAVEAVTRLVDAGVARHPLADSLIGVLGQRLVRRLDPAAAVPAPEDDAEVRAVMGPSAPADLGARRARDPAARWWKGRAAVQDYLEWTPAVRAALKSAADPAAIEAAARGEGYRDLYQNGMGLVADGAVPLAELQRVCGEGASR